jgi:hypothetical protein
MWTSAAVSPIVEHAFRTYNCHHTGSPHEPIHQVFESAGHQSIVIVEKKHELASSFFDATVPGG